MNTVIILLAMLAISTAVGAPATADESVKGFKLPTLQREEVHDKLGQYALRYITARGNVVSERGRLIPTPDKNYVMIVEGKVYIGEDGKTYITKYTIDHDGIKIEGDHLPVPT